jgi:hypothetical protein
MWRSVAIGVVLAGVLAGCSDGGSLGSEPPCTANQVHVDLAVVQDSDKVHLRMTVSSPSACTLSGDIPVDVTVNSAGVHPPHPDQVVAQARDIFQSGATSLRGPATFDGWWPVDQVCGSGQHGSVTFGVTLTGGESKSVTRSVCT